MRPTSEMKCPNCNEDLKKELKRKSKCPHCDKYIYPRTTADNKRVLATEADLKQLEAEEKQRWEEDNRKWEESEKQREIEEERMEYERRKKELTSRSFEYLKNKCSVNERQLEKIKKELEDNFKQPPSIDDVLWKTFHVCLRQANEKNDWKTASEISLLQAGILFTSRKKPAASLKAHFTYELKLMKQKGIKQVYLNPSRQSAEFQSCSNCVSACAENFILDTNKDISVLNEICNNCECADLDKRACFEIEPVA